MKKLDIGVWQAACDVCQEAIPVAEVYDGKFVYYFPTLNNFVVAAAGSPVKELAEKFLEAKVCIDFAIQANILAKARAAREETP
jgi:hypothetical protein